MAESVADAAAVNPNDINILLASGLSIFFIKGKAVFRNGPKNLSRLPYFMQLGF